MPEAEFEALLRHAPPALELVLLLAHESGLRAEAALKFCRANVDMEARRIIGTTKHKARYDLPMSQRLYERLLWYMAAPVDNDEPFVCAFMPHRRPLTQNAMRKAMQQARKDAGLTSLWGIHDLRRTLARKIYASTRDIRKVQAMLGHRMLWTTCWYLGNGLQSLDHADMEQALNNQEQRRQA